MSKIQELLKNNYVDYFEKAKNYENMVADPKEKSIICAEIAKAAAIIFIAESINHDDSMGNITNLITNTNCNTDTITNTNTADNGKWEVPLDENGIPYLTDADRKHPKRIITFNQLKNTPEIQAKIKKYEEEKAKSVMNDTPKADNTKADTDKKPAPAKKPTAKKPATKKANTVSSIEESRELINKYIEDFGYEEDQEALDTLVMNFTDSAVNNLEELKTQEDSVIEGFALFVKEQLANAYEELEKLQNSALAPKLDSIVAEAFEDENATVQNSIRDYNIIDFINLIKVEEAKEQLQVYLDNYEESDILDYVKEYLDSDKATFEDLNDSNIVGLVNYLNSLSDDEE